MGLYTSLDRASDRRHLIVLFLLLVAGTGVAWAGGAETRAKGDAGRGPGKDVPYLRIATPDGIYQVRFFGESDGPIEIPLQHERYTALLLVPELTEQGWRVNLGIQEEVLRISPLGQVDLAIGREVPVGDLGSLGIQGWSMTLEPGPLVIETIDDCCGCGRINCCPATHKCMSCGDCGTCCGGPLPV